MKRILAVLVLLLCCSTLTYAREEAHGYCFQGGHKIVTQGLNSTNYGQESYPSCTVTVYDAGTTTLSSIYSDNSGTVKGNPFTSDADGWWFFYANNGRYDVHFSNGGINTPYTQGDYLLCDPADSTGSFSCTGGGAASCPNGPTDTRYVDSGAGNDTNSGRNWCSAYATEGAAVTALTASGGWIYVAPDYTGTAASAVPANIHILETNQFDAVGPSVRRYSYPDWTADTENVLPSLDMLTATPTSTTTVITNSKIFGESYKRAAITGSTLTPSTSTGTDDSIGVLGISNAQGSQAQSTGVEGICYSELDSTDCSGVVGIATASTGTNTASSLEAGWFQVEPLSATSNVVGVAVRGTSSNMPTANTSGNLPTAAFDIRGSGTTLQSWLNGLYMEDWTTSQPIYLGLNRTPAGVVNADRGNNGIQLAWQYALATKETSQMRVDGSSTTGNVGGNFQFLNNRQSTTVSLGTQVSGNVQVGAINAVTFSSTPTFDRTLGLVQTITLTANVTSSTLSNCSAGQTIIFDIIEDGTGGYTFAWPATVHGGGSITTTASEHNRQSFYCDGTDAWSVSAMQSGT